jgi:hypothetical protein
MTLSLDGRCPKCDSKLEQALPGDMEGEYYCPWCLLCHFGLGVVRAMMPK